MKMTLRILLNRKLLFYYRKSKFRRTRDSKRRSSSSASAGTDREKCSSKNRGWMGVDTTPFIVFICFVCFFPISLGFPVNGGAGQEIADTEAFKRYSGSVPNNTNYPVFSESEPLFRKNQVFFSRYKDKENWMKDDERHKLELTNWNVNRSVGRNNLLQPANFRQSKRHVKERKKRKHLFVTDDVQNYLMSFGYLPPSDKETGLLRTEDQLRSAIKNLQNFANIPATGELDKTTLELLKKPRCGLPDIPFSSSTRKKRYTLHGQKWMYTNLTWSLRTFQPRNLDSGRVRAVLYHALDVWARHSKLTFQELNSDRADILVYFHSGYHGDGYAFDGRGQVLAHAFFPGKERGGDAHFDEDEVWILDPYADLEQVEGTSLFAVAAHEFGHSLGLSHSSVQGALMFPWYQGYEGLTPDLQLPDDDKHAIQQLYGPKDTKLWARIPSYDPYQPEQPRPEPPRPEPPRREPPRPEPPRREPPRPEPPRREPPRPEPPRREPPRPEPPRREPPRPEIPNPGPPVYVPPRPTRPPTTPSPRPRPRPTPPPPRPPPRPPPPYEPEKTPGKPDTCNTSYDAISVIRNEVFIFKDKYLWRIGDDGLRKDYPAEINRLWYGLPENFTHVDAVYERNDKKIVFFIGKWYYVFDANYLMHGYPKPIHYLGLPRELDHVDAAMVWGHNGKTYFFSGTMYWRFDEEVGRVELDYPRDMSMWRGVGYNIDAIFQWKDGNTYFFKGKGFWKFNDMRMRVENERQTLSAQFWMGCPRTTEIDESFTNRPSIRYQTASSSSPLIANIHCLLIIFIARFYSIIA